MNNNPELATATAVSFFDPRPRPLLDDGEKDQTAAKNGKPLEMQDEHPKRLYHRTNRESAMAIVEQGFLVGGGPEVESGKAHNYFSDKPLEDIAYKSGVRASAKFELVVDTEIAMYFGALFFRTVSDGVLTTDRVHPRAVLGIRDTTTNEAVWSAEATELIKLGKDMTVASPESYLCFVNHPLEETITDDPMENIAEPPAKVARTASTGAGGNPVPSPRGRTITEGTLPFPKRARIQPPPPAASTASSSTDVPKTKAVLQPTHKGVKKMGAKASATQGTPDVPKATSPTKPTPASPPPRTTTPATTATAPPAKGVALIEVDREGLKFKTYDCERCNTVVFVGQHVCFGCNLRLRNTANFSSASRRFLAVSRKNLLREVCRNTDLKFTDLTARDLRPTKDVTGKLPKIPEAATLERAKNHLVRAKEKGFQTIEERYGKDPVFAANMMENGQTVSNIRIWECLTSAVIPATQRSAAQRALNLGASQVPMGETAEDYPARTVHFYGVPGEALRAANLISDASDPNVCIGFGGTFFNLKNFAELLYHQPKITTTLITFQGHWRIPPVDVVNSFKQYLTEWFRANEEQMIAAYDQQMAVAAMNRERQLAAKASAGGDPRPSTEGKGPEKGKAKGKGKGKPKGKR